MGARGQSVGFGVRRVTDPWAGVGAGAWWVIGRAPRVRSRVSAVCRSALDVTLGVKQVWH